MYTCITFLTKEKFRLLFMSAASIKVRFRLDFIEEANSMIPDKTAHLRAVWSGYILFAIKDYLRT